MKNCICIHENFFNMHYVLCVILGMSHISISLASDIYYPFLLFQLFILKVQCIIITGMYEI